MVEFEPNRASGFLGNRISEGHKDGTHPRTDDREMQHYSMILYICNEDIVSDKKIKIIIPENKKRLILATMFQNSKQLATGNTEIVKKTPSTVVPVMNGHPRDQAKVSVHCRWPLIRGNLTLTCVGRGIDNVAVQGRWPLTTGVAQGRY